jgi:hypothetical protein
MFTAELIERVFGYLDGRLLHQKYYCTYRDGVTLEYSRPSLTDIEDPDRSEHTGKVVQGFQQNIAEHHVQQPRHILNVLETVGNSSAKQWEQQTDRNDRVTDSNESLAQHMGPLKRGACIC